jgi:hypothetical protein
MQMRLSVRGLALACGLLWAIVILGVGLAALGLGVKDGSYYGQDFLLVVASIYPGYRGVPQLGDILTGTAYGFLDGLIGGAIIAWIYNLAAGREARQAS